MFLTILAVTKQMQRKIKFWRQQWTYIMRRFDTAQMFFLYKWLET